MSFGNGSHGGRASLGTKVYLNVYDLSPANDYLYAIGLGLHHSGVEVSGTEYSFASGAGVFDSPPKVAPGAKFRQQIEVGAFDGGAGKLQQALTELRVDFGPDDYNLVRKNCNHFANALCWKLVRTTIPGHVNRLSDIGVCCSCLLPRQLLEHAPVGDPNDANPNSGFLVRAGNRSVAPAPQAFSGTGARLGSATTTTTTASTSILGRWKSPTATKKEDDLTDRREKARQAALARLARNSQSENSPQSR
jgi:hypothetical protein